MVTLFRRFRAWLRFSAPYIFRDFITGVKNLIYWFPIIWKDRNWDDFFIFAILKHKLISQAKYISSRNIHTNAKRDAEIMMTCVRLIDKIQEEYYVMERTKYVKLDMSFEDNIITFNLVDDNIEEYFKKYPLIYKKVISGHGLYNLTADASNDMIAMGMAYLNHQRAKKLLFKIIEENIEKWWD